MRLPPIHRTLTSDLQRIQPGGDPQSASRCYQTNKGACSANGSYQASDTSVIPDQLYGKAPMSFTRRRKETGKKKQEMGKTEFTSFLFLQTKYTPRLKYHTTTRHPHLLLPVQGPHHSHRRLQGPSCQPTEPNAYLVSLLIVITYRYDTAPVLRIRLSPGWSVREMLLEYLIIFPS